MRRLMRLLLVLLALWPATATAQPELPAHVYQTLVEVCDAYPWPVVQSDEHLGEILNAVAWTHRAEGWGLSRKTGGRHVESPVGPIAEDILQTPDGHHYDVLGSAARGNPLRPGRARSIGVIDLRNRPWVAPIAARLSWESAPGPTPAPTPTPVQPPAVTVDLAPVLAALDRIEQRITALESRPVPDPAPPDLGLVNEFVDDMIGNGPVGATDNHITDILKRLDVLRVQQEQAFAWLRSRRALGF